MGIAAEALADQEPTRLCPSARCESGALLLGVVGADGRVGFVVPPLPVDDAFVAQASLGRAAETRFRFAGRCVEAECWHWRENRCTLVDTAVRTLAAQAGPRGERSPRPCGIRRSCRWFAQHGRAACDICPLIVTEVPSTP
jgi:hypothetical protein